MSRLEEIIDGHVNEFKGLVGIGDKEEEKVFKKREMICVNCPLKTGNSCNSSLVITDKLKSMPFDNTMKLVYDDKHIYGKYYVTKEGVKVSKGCGCRLSAKQKSPTSICPAGFWGGEFKN
jgi:hypothetical protein